MVVSYPSESKEEMVSIPETPFIRLDHVSSIVNPTGLIDPTPVIKTLSTIEFELPVLFAKNVKGSFNNMEGFIEIDVSQKENNKAIFYVEVNDLEMNYTKYKDLLLSNIFFDANQFPKAVVDTKKFSYVNETELELQVELTIKGKSEIVPLIINVKRLAEELVQIQSELTFSRTDYKIGIGKWKNTSILKDKVILKTNLFLFRES